MNDQTTNNIEDLSFLDKFKLTVKQTPPEKAFYAGVFIIASLLSLFIAGMIFLRTLAVVSPSYNTSLSIGTVEQPKYFTPIYANEDLERVISGLIYSGLYKKDINNNYVYDLAESVTKNEDGTRIDVVLKPGLSFSNGKPLTSDDVIFTYNLLSNPQVKSIDKVRYEGLEFEKISDTEFTITIKKPFPFVEEVLTAGILSVKDYENESLNDLILSEKNQAGVASGLYEISNVKLSSDGRISQISLVSNANHKYERPYIRYIEIHHYKDAKEIAAAYNNKDIDVVMDASKDIKANIVKKNFNTNTYALPRIVSLFLNSNKKDSFAKKSIRQSIYESINRDEFAEYGIPAFDMLPGSDHMTTTNIDSYSSSTFSISIPNVERSITIGEIIKKSLEKNGIIVTVDVKDQSDLSQNIIRNREYEALLSTIEIQSPTDLYAFWHSSQRNAPGLNISSYTSKNFDAKLEAIKVATDTATVDSLMSSMRSEFYDEYPYIPLYTPTKEILVRNNVSAIFPKSIKTSKDLVSDVAHWYNDTELIWPIFNNQNFIKKLYSILH